MTTPDATELATPTLLRGARGTYASSIRTRLHAAGIDGLPRNGAFILAAVERSGGQVPDLPAELGVTRQAVSQVIEILVSRGYLDRVTDAEDRRRIRLALTETGMTALEVIAGGVEAVDAQLHELLPDGQVEVMRAGLRALGQIKVTDTASEAGRRRPARQLRRFSPIFPVADLAAALAHYTSLGFTTRSYAGGPGYGFAARDGVELHLEEAAGADLRAGGAYLFVADADTLHAEWTRPGIGGHTHTVEAKPWGMREGSHTDPDGNLIRFGTPVDE